MVRKPTMPSEVLEYFRKQGAEGGKKRFENTTPEQRSLSAKKAAKKSAEVRRKKAKKEQKALD
jgi:uncharacterized protein YdaU (DUF1376 family)